MQASRLRLRWSLLTALPALALVAAAGAATAGAATVPSGGPGPAVLTSVSCTSSTFCMAVGAASAVMPTQLAAERWDGARWHRLPIAKPPGTAFAGLEAVACPSSTECVAVGSGTTGTTPGSSTISLAGTWTAARGWTSSRPMPPAGARGSDLDAISCPATSLCFAAGGFSTGTGLLPLAERWTGGSWTRDTLSTPAGAVTAALEGIACPGAGHCTAVGAYSNAAGGTPEGLIEQLSGTTWTGRTAPASAGGMLSGISCPTATVCEAVGQTRSGLLAERWAGGSWAPASPPAPGKSGIPFLNGVSCAAATRCVAIGGRALTSSTGIAFIDTLNPSWTLTAQTGSGFGIARLNAVSCWPAAATAPGCALLGDTTSATATQQPLSAFLTGTKWTIVPTL